MTNKLRQEFIEKERQKLVDEQTHVRDELRNLREAYGICEDCGKAIETERLEVKPDATLCLTCQQKAEQRARRNRPVRQIDW